MTEKKPQEGMERETRPLWPAIASGLCSRCPACGDGALFGRFLKPATTCNACGQPFTGHQADDFPAYIVILLLGHILIPVMIEVNHAFDVPLFWQSLIWPSLALILAIAMLQPAKGGVIALQWAKRMHGFATEA